VGFAWHQGWNDGSGIKTTAQYESNLANLIRDVRIDLGVPDLLISIGVSGMEGWNGNKRRTDIAVASVETRDFYRDKLASHGVQHYHWNNNCESYWLIGQAMGEAVIDLIRK
jgi:hypothetical protein